MVWFGNKIDIVLYSELRKPKHVYSIKFVYTYILLKLKIIIIIIRLFVVISFNLQNIQISNYSNKV